MIRSIVIKEFREMVRDGRFRAAGAATLVLLLGALIVGWRSAADIRAQHADASRTTRENWINQPPKNPHSAAHYGVYAFKPKTALAFLDEGIDPYTGVASYLEAHAQNEFTNRPAADASVLQRFAGLTAATVLQILVPLLIVILAAGVVAGEREQGTLRQLQSLGVPPATLAAGKLLGAGAALLALLVPAAIIGAVALAAQADLGSAAGRVGLLALAYLAYFAAWIGVTLAVSARAPSTRSALVVLLGLWMLNSLLVPRATTDLARRLHPAPSALEFQRTLAREQQVDETGKTYEQYEKEVEARVLAQYGVDSLSQLPVSFAGISLDASEQWGDRVFDRNYGKLWDTFAAQERVRSWVGAVFPFLAIRGVSQGLSGTDLHHHRAFSEAAERYRRYLVKTMNDELTEKAAGKDFQYVSDVAVWAKATPFDYETPGLGFVLERRAIDLVVLAGWTMLALAAGLAATRRVTP